MPSVRVSSLYLTVSLVSFGCSQEVEPSRPGAMEMAPAAGTTVDFAQVVAIFDASCAGCHNATTPQAGLTLGPSSEVPAADVRLNLVGVNAMGLPSKQLVQAGNANESFLYLKVAPMLEANVCPSGCGNPMPPPNGLPIADSDVIKAWIDQGAN